MAEALQPLSGVRVLDLSRYLPGPYLTRILADLGADVVKVESPEGDPTRLVPPMAGDQTAVFAALNHGKRSVVLDLKSQLGAELLRAMAAAVDVVVESFRPGVMARLGIDYDNLARANERIVLCSISGYGQEGPLRDVAGHDLNYLARAGVLAMFGPKDGVPVVPAVQIADLAGGALPAAVAVLAALMERDRIGRGRMIDISITRGALSLLAIELARRAAGDAEPRGEGYLTGGVPCYRAYRTKDGGFMALAALEPKFFAAFCERAGCPHLAPFGLTRGEQGAAAMRELESIFAGRTRQEWIRLLDGIDACCEPLQSPEEAFADPGVGARSIDLGGLSFVRPELGVPLSEDARRAVPPLGAHGLEVARELGLDADLVERAVADGALLPGLVGEEGRSRDRTP